MADRILSFLSWLSMVAAMIFGVALVALALRLDCPVHIALSVGFLLATAVTVVRLMMTAIPGQATA